MKKVIGVRFKPTGKMYYFDPGELTAEKGGWVIVETARGQECGEVVQPVHSVADASIQKPLKKVLRAADSVDIRRAAANRENEQRAFRICEERIQKHKLDMKLVEVEYPFDSSKILFYFTADGRVDFRDLVKDLAATFHTRIELRQIGVRDESKMLGGIGICGQPFCCSRFLRDFQPVSIRMAKEQGLSLNPAKISGSCGRLMCCLSYEQPAYDYLSRITPGQGSTVNTPDGEGTVLEVNLISGKLRVRTDGLNEPMGKWYTRADCTYVCGGKRAPVAPDPVPEEIEIAESPEGYASFLAAEADDTVTPLPGRAAKPAAGAAKTAEGAGVKAAETAKIAETEKTAEVVKNDEAGKTVETVKAAETETTVEVTKAAETVKAAEAAKNDEAEKAAETAKTAETEEPAGAENTAGAGAPAAEAPAGEPARE